MLDLSFCKTKFKTYGLRFEEMEKAVLGTSIHAKTTCENVHLIIDWKAQSVFG